MQKTLEQTQEQFTHKLEQVLSKDKTLHFMLVGRTGVGKSSTVNSLLGADVAPVGRHEPTTMDVTVYAHEHGGVKYKIIDTPGLCDDLPEMGKDSDYLNKIKSYSSSVDLIWFVSELDAARVTSDEKRGMKMLTKALGENCWGNSIIVLTRSDRSEAFEDDLENRSILLRKEIGKYYPKSNEIPVVAVSNKYKTLPNGKKWLGELFTQVFLSFKDEESVHFLKSMERDIGIKNQPDAKTPSPEVDIKEEAKAKEGQKKEEPKEEQEEKTRPRIELDENQKQKIKESLWKRVVGGVQAGAMIGAKIGKAIGGKGEAIGGMVGAVVGGLVGWMFR